MEYFKELKMFVKTVSITLPNIFCCHTDRGCQGRSQYPFLLTFIYFILKPNFKFSISYEAPLVNRIKASPGILIPFKLF